ncbi:MAG: type III-B CRISPR module RAMP protein Cmr4 [Akkermansiaceae bacterium]|nr:type III-B CRISPR module RAMP protein Cmr4 [Akkermansiaceae bacterium]
METKLLYLFTRTPLHVGAGSSVGAIDQPIQRERHTQFPIIPGSSLKGSLTDQWPASQIDDNGKASRLTTEKQGDKSIVKMADPAAWLFGSDTTELSFAGSLLFSEATLLAFPIRSAKGSYAWVTCPHILAKAHREGVLVNKLGTPLPAEDQAIYQSGAPLDLDGTIVLEDYALTLCINSNLASLAEEMSKLVDDEIYESIKERLVIVSDHMMTHFVSTACEVATHVRIDDRTGTAEGTGLFNQENVPSETLFYAPIRATKSRVPNGEYADKTDADALAEFGKKVAAQRVFQFGADASIGLGYCSATLQDMQPSPTA